MNLKAIEEFESARAKAADGPWRVVDDHEYSVVSGPPSGEPHVGDKLFCCMYPRTDAVFVVEAANKATLFTKALRSAIEALKFYADHPIVIKEAYHSNEERQITCMHTFINHKAVETLKEIERILLEEK